MCTRKSATWFWNAPVLWDLTENLSVRRPHQTARGVRWMTMQTDTPEKEDLKPVWAITAAHTAVDFYMTLFPPLLAVFKLHFGLSLVQTSLLPAVVSVFGAVPQPFIHGATIGLPSRSVARPSV